MFPTDAGKAAPNHPRVVFFWAKKSAGGGGIGGSLLDGVAAGVVAGELLLA